ncbi:carboxylate-amine ligase [Kitasatospora purpeofusca]|uniref:carboxylate-amine ligase n=1 Tax=Kitasatospora purpeofusca TaxID=67352 RepID=UPI0035E0F466
MTSPHDPHARRTLAPPPPEEAATRTSRGGLRFGVEEEYLLADPGTRMTVAKARAVVREAGRVLGERAQLEFLQTQVEACTPPAATAAELRAQVLAMRRAMVHAAASAGCLLVASGSPVLASRHPLPVTDTDRYRRVAAHVGRPVWNQSGGELCGCHVHLGDLERGEALALAAHLQPWLPVLQAACVNSPFCEGEDLGMASSRWLRYRAWPTCGPAPLLDENGYEHTVQRLIAENVILDRKMIYWALRPSEHLPTLEVRIADSNADADVPVLLAVLLRGLALALLDEHRAGVPPPTCPTVLLRAAHLRASMVGLNGTGLDPVAGQLVPAAVLLRRLLTRAAPGLVRSGDLQFAQATLRRLLAGGTGADRQRAVFAQWHSLSAVVDHLARLTCRMPTSRRVVLRALTPKEL